MNARSESQPSPVKQPATVEQRSERELVITRTINGPARIVFEAWTRPELFQRWWVPKSIGIALESCEMDVRTGGTYRLVFAGGAAFHGRYLEVTPPSRLVWTNEESGPDGQVTTVTFEERGGKTVVVVHELYPSKESLDATGAAGAAAGMIEAFDQLDALIAELAPGGHGA